MKEVGGEIFGAKNGVEKSLGKGRGCVFGSSSKQLEWPHHELVHYWLLVHSNWYTPHGRSHGSFGIWNDGHMTFSLVFIQKEQFMFY